MEVVVSMVPPPVRVQTLADGGAAQVPSQYVQPPEHCPISSSTGGVPVIDLFNFDPQHSTDVRPSLQKACSEWGAFQVINHGVPQILLDGIRNGGLSFYNDCPMEEKLGNYSSDPNSAASEGYGSRMLVKEESVLDWRDYFDHHTLPLSRRNPSKWPPIYREIMVEYSDQMKVLASKLLSMISEGLGLESSCIEDAVGEFYQNITISYYPPCPQPQLTLGLQAHSDMGAITLLIQDDVGGLEVLKDGEWINTQPLSDAIVVILADQTEIITNGQYRSSVHRAITNVNRARLSVATFHDPAKTKKISPAAKILSKEYPARYREVVYGDYVSSWYTRGPEGKQNIDALLLDQ